MDRRVARQRVLEQREMEIGQRYVIEREAAAPRLRQRRLADDDHRHEERQRADEEAPCEQRPLPVPEPYRAALATLAGERDIALAAGQVSLQREEQDGDYEQRHRVCRSNADLRWIFEELPELRGHDMKASGQREQRWRAKQR